MKKTLLTLALLITLSIAANAQLSNLNAGINGNYTSYYKPTPGAQLRIGYDFTRKYSAVLGFAYGLPINENITNGDFEDKSQSQFSALTLSAMYHLIGNTEDNFSIYLPVGASYVMIAGKETLQGITTVTKASGTTINLGLGTQFKIGLPVLFAEAGIALPSGTGTTNSREGFVENPNPVPFHSILSLGIKFPFGSDNGYGF